MVPREAGIPWRFSRPDWMKLWATWPGLTMTNPQSGGWTRDLLRSCLTNDPMDARHVNCFRKNQETVRECCFLVLFLKMQIWRTENLKCLVSASFLLMRRCDVGLCTERLSSCSQVWCEIPCWSSPSFQQVPLESVICKIPILHWKKIDLSDDADSLLDKGSLL